MTTIHITRTGEQYHAERHHHDGTAVLWGTGFTHAQVVQLMDEARAEGHQVVLNTVTAPRRSTRRLMWRFGACLAVAAAVILLPLYATWLGDAMATVWEVVR